MENYEFYNKTKIIFGKDAELKASKEIKKYSAKILLVHYGDGIIEKMGLYDRVTKSLKEEGVEYIEFVGIRPNPVLSKVNEGIKVCKDNSIGAILAIGGGSVIDTAKAISAGVLCEGNLWDYFQGKAGIIEKALPLGVISTMAASGSETSSGTVITNEDGMYKRFIDSTELRPVFTVLNPELTTGIPPFLTACGIVDVLSHTMEKYFTPNWQVDFTDRLCEALFRSVINCGRKVVADPSDYDARAEIMLAASFSHNGYTDGGRMPDWASHIIEHELSALYDVPHAAGLSVIIPAWMKYVYKININRFVQYAIRVWDVDFAYGNLEDIALEGIRRTENFFKELDMPTKLGDLKIDPDRFEEMAEKSVEGGPFGSFMKLNKEDVVNILKMTV